ncbi:MAG: hypothetical protein GX452_06840 [Ignavibacteriales bacterium]|mgnify:FL=1|nr:hypothetical protein [Ignavibacteriales bacterium]HOJ17592.1 Spy/CpxP family protein refolding chaperone [Ignavibacteriaceae bacterium]
MRSLKSIILVLTMLLVSTPIYAQRGDCYYMQQRLNLTDSQTESVLSLRNAADKDIIDLRAEQDKLILKKKELYGSKSLDKSALRSIEEKIVDNQKKIRLRNFDFRMAVYDLLDDNQKAEWNKGGQFFRNKKDMGNRRFNNNMNRPNRLRNMRNLCW